MRKTKSSLSAILSLAGLLFLAGIFFPGCNKRTLVYSGESEPEGFVLSFQQPEIFQFEILKPGQYSLTLEIVYFSEQMQDQNGVLPMYYILEGPGLGNGKDRKFGVEVLEDTGEWRGELQENEHDRLFEDVVEKAIQLEAGKYKMKLYADSREQGKAIPGMVRISLKVYK